MSNTEDDLDRSITEAQLEILMSRSSDSLIKEHDQVMKEAQEWLGKEHDLLESENPDIPEVVNLTAFQDILRVCIDDNDRLTADMATQLFSALHERLLRLEGYTIDQIGKIIQTTQDPDGLFAEVRRNRTALENRANLLLRALEGQVMRDRISRIQTMMTPPEDPEPWKGN